MEKEKQIFAVSGKGGVGKTTLVALMTKILAEKKQNTMLVIDANPDSNLSDLLGVSVTNTVGAVADDLKRSIEKGKIPQTVSKKDILESRVFETLEELENYDLLVMGRSEGEGCYCFVNKVLTDIIDTLSKNYDLVLMDEHAGLEHLSRRTDRDVDVMIIVTDPSSMGFQTARRIKELAKEVHIDFKKIYLVGNRFNSDLEPVLKDEANKMGIECAGIIPDDSEIFERNLKGQPLSDLPPESPALSAVKGILTRIGLLD